MIELQTEAEELRLKLFQTVYNKIRHKDYGRTVELARDYKQLATGEGLDKRLKQYVRREDTALFEQRVTITNHIVTAIVKNLMDVYYKIPRSNSARRTVMHTSDKEKSKKLEGVLAKFWGASSFDKYLATRSVELNKVDPNTFTAIEWKPFNADEELLKPYPFEIPSENAINYEYVNGELQFLIVAGKIRYRKNDFDSATVSERLDPKHGTKKGEKYTIYGKNQTIVIAEVDPLLVNWLNTATEGELFKGTYGNETAVFVKLGKKTFRYMEALPHNCGAVLAWRMGCTRDMRTNGRTFVAPYHDVIPYLDKTIKVNSELDLVATILAHPQQIKYGDDCEDVNCSGGVNRLTEKTCGTCHGTGLKRTAGSSQDAIVLRRPRDPKDAIPLKDFLHYYYPPIAIIEWQQQYIDHCTKQARLIMTGSDTFTKTQSSKTATGENIDLQSVYDMLYPFTEMYASSFVFAVKNIAKLTDLATKDEEGADEMVIGFTFGKDHKLKSLDTLIVDLERVSKIGNNALKSHIEDDIALIIYGEKPLENTRYKTQKMYKPFKDKTETEVMLALSSPYVSAYDKILHLNFNRIFEELEIEAAKKVTKEEAEKSEGKKTQKKAVNFYDLPRSKQTELIKNKVAEFKERLEAENPEPTLELE